MAKQTITLGTSVNDGTGDPLRTAFTKVNANFTELYTSVATIPTDINDLADADGLLSASDLGNFKIEGNTLGTIDDGNTWGGSSINISPNGEGYTWINIPNDSGAASGASLQIGNTSATGTGIQLITDDGNWTFKPNGKLAGPVAYEGSSYNLELETNLLMNKDRGFIVELGRFPHAIDGDDWWFDVVVNRNDYVYALGGADIGNGSIIVKFDKYGEVVWQREYTTSNTGVNMILFTSADWDASGNLVAYGQGHDVDNNNEYIARFTVNSLTGAVTTPVGEIIKANDDVANVPSVYADQIRYNADKSDYAMVGSKYGGDSLPLTISTSSSISTTPGILKIAKTSIVAAFGASVPQTNNNSWGITGYGFTGINQFTGISEVTTDSIDYYLLETDSSVDFSALPSGESWAIRFYDWSNALIITDDWVKSFDTGNEEDYFTSVAFDSDGNIYAGGSTGQLSSNAGYTSLLVSTTSTGTVRWAKRIEDEEGSGFNYIQGITVDSDDYIYTVAYDDNGQTVITKLSSNGTVQWIKTMTIDEGMSSHYSSKIQYCSVDDTIVIALEYSSITSYNDDFLLIKMGLDGSVEWANSFGSSSEESVNWDSGQDFLSVDDNYIYVSGSRYIGGFDDNAMLFAFPHDGVASGWVGPYNVRNSLESLTFATGSTANYSVSTLTSSDQTANLTMASYTVTATDTDYDYRKVNLNGGHNKIKNVAEIIFADGTTQSTSASDVPQVLIMDNYGTDNHIINSGDRGGHILINVFNGDCNIYVPLHSVDPLPIGSVVTLVLNEPSSGNKVYVEGNYNEDTTEEVYIRVVGQDAYTNRYWYIGGDDVQGLYTLMKIDNNVWILSGPSIVNNN